VSCFGSIKQKFPQWKNPFVMALSLCTANFNHQEYATFKFVHVQQSTTTLV